MPGARSSFKLSDKALGQLQGMMLKAVLTASPLPGHSRPLDLPDLSLVLGQPAVVLSSENLGGPITVEGAAKPLYILPEEAILERAQREGDLNYLRFQPPHRIKGGVLLTLQISIAPRVPGSPVLGLSGVQVTFYRSGRRWQAAEETAAFAA